MKHRPYTKQELNIQAKEYCASLRKRVNKHRSNCPVEDFLSLKDDSWDIPRVAVSCASQKPPFISENGRNCSYMRNIHPTLLRAHQIKGIQIGSKPPRVIKGAEYFVAGQCAEPHAAHRLLNQMDKVGRMIGVNDILFSLAYKVKNSTVRAYCQTCKTIFPQL